MGRTQLTLTVIAIAALAGGCTKERVAGGKPSDDKDRRAKVGLVTKTDSNPYFVTLREAGKAEAAKRSADFIALAGKFDGDNDGQVTAVENLIQQGVNTILITPNNATGVLNVIKQARDKGVLVIALD